MKFQRTLTWILGMQISLILAGCSSSDERLARFAADSTARQAEQNREIVRVTVEAAENHRRIIEASEQSRQRVLQLESDIQKQKVRLDDERRSLANERYRESLLVPVLDNIGLLLIASLPLVLAWYLLHGLRSETNDDVSEVLVRELVSGEPMRLSMDERQRIEDRTMQPPEDDAELPF